MAEQTTASLPQRPAKDTLRVAGISARRARWFAWVAATAMFAITLPFLLIATNARLVINSSQLYEWDFNRYDIESRTGLPRSELRSATGQIVDYFNNDEEFLDIRVRVGGEVVSLYREREILHMRDVKTLIQGVYSVQFWTLMYAVLFIAGGLFLRRRSFLPLLKRGVIWSAIGAVAVVAVLGIISLIDFDAVFLQFHLLSFANDLWQLDPYRDYLLIMFPQRFFLDATLAIAALTIAEFGLISVGVWWLSRKFYPRADSAPAA